MARFIYVHAVLVLTLSNIGNAQDVKEKCTECPLEIDPVCIGNKCAAVCVGESCEVPLKEACRLYHKQELNEQRIYGELEAISSTPTKDKICYYRKKQSVPIPFKIE